MTFNDLKLSAPLLKAVSEAGYETPSPIQASAIPPVLEGRDLMGCAQTGTGKTAAFALPMLDRLSAAPRKKGAVRALILTPTRELAGPILFLLIFNIVQFACRFFLMYWSYNLGTKAIDILTANAKEFTRAASMLGVFIVGALTSNYGGTTVATVIENGDSPIVIQSILDGVLPKLIPLALTLGLFFLMKKKNWKPVTCIALLLVIGLVGAFFGIFA